MAGTCRLLASRSITISCKPEISRLIEAVGKKENDREIVKLTDEVFKCGLTPSSHLTDEQLELPAGLLNALKRSMQAKENTDAFMAVLTKQIEDREARTKKELEEKAANKH